MKKIYTRFLILASLMSVVASKAQTTEETTLRIYDDAVFYDGYQGTNPDKNLDDGILRFSCSLYSVKLTDEQLDRIGNKLDLNVYISALCDNYDRIGNINLAFAKKGGTRYSTNSTPRIELGRFITPFMDKNREPSTVPYSYNMDYLSLILKDKDIRATYDLWLEFEIFGIPYAANQQIRGCAGRNDVFQGTLEFVTKGSTDPTEGNVVVPIVIKKPENTGNNLNNYNQAATDTIGKTTKTYKFTVPEDMEDAQIVLITSNHGANTNGEEYNRRNHFIYYDDALVMMYKPGRTSCEPFRKYNTQANGIYWYYPMSDEEWQSFSNWCPGDVIDNRIISLGKVEKGEHKVRISVPDAVFNERQGDIPVSMYFHGVKNGTITSSVDFPAIDHVKFRIVEEDNYLSIIAEELIEGVEIFSLDGSRKYWQDGGDRISVASFAKGVYLVSVEFESGRIETKKVYLHSK